MPTPPPSPLPSQVPTVFTCTYTDDGDYDPTAYLALAKPKLTAVSATGSPLALAATDGADAYFSRRFGLLSSEPPGSAFSFTATLADGTTVGGDSGSAGRTLQDLAARVDAVLKTATVYLDETSVAVAYQLFDAAERTAVLATNLTVTMRLQHDTNTSLSSSVVCGDPDAISGVGLCALEVVADWFSTASAQTATVYLALAYGGGDDVATSDYMILVLSKAPVHTALATANMYATLLYHPKLAGDFFTVPIYAYTNGQALSVWVLKCTYDTSVLTYTSTATSSFYTAAVVTAGSGTVSLSTSGLQSSVATSSVTGDAVLVATLTFQVNSDATVASHAGAFSFKVTSMVNPYSIAFASGKTGQVNDARGGARSSCTLTVSALAYLKLFAYAAQSELVNTAPLNGMDVTTSVSAVAVRNWDGYANVVVTASATCSLDDEAADASVLAVSSSCNVTLSDYHSAGSTGVKVIRVLVFSLICQGGMRRVINRLISAQCDG
jgi:hypothetical protein